MGHESIAQNAVQQEINRISIMFSDSSEIPEEDEAFRLPYRSRFLVSVGNQLFIYVLIAVLNQYLTRLQRLQWEKFHEA